LQRRKACRTGIRDQATVISSFELQLIASMLLTDQRTG
jgi:hypothetical protein